MIKEITRYFLIPTLYTDENKNDVFVHYSNITMEGRKSLNQNDIVEFEIGEGKDGRTQAVNVKVVSESSNQ